ncbi:MAG TPA: aminodeoxychorismate/anthranilate synthase component II [Lachnospiraceae bacterium]|nr:aminodeoxychorismate/anthranilate synthase component II [Lachnospiraceae bacterium]
MILLIDNYDSFSYNLFQMVGTILPKGEEMKVIRNDAMTVDEILDLNPSGIILSPGPGRPADAGVTEEVAKVLGQKIPTLGVCLGHQGICETFGATVTYAKQLMHGKQSVAELDLTSPIFRGLPEKIKVARYHSLAVDEKTIPKDALKVIARTEDGEVMAVQHVSYPIFGVQFHPESIMTPEGGRILENFVRLSTGKEPGQEVSIFDRQ